MEILEIIQPEKQSNWSLVSYLVYCLIEKQLMINENINHWLILGD